jgi:Ca-activated chloride channel homolog
MRLSIRLRTALFAAIFILATLVLLTSCETRSDARRGMPITAPPRGEQQQSLDLSSPDQQYHTRDMGEGADDEKLGKPPKPHSNDHSNRSHDNPFRSTNSAGGDASTFSIDVDTASYALARRTILQQKQLPSADQVRIEELLNSFTYHYKRPSSGAEDPIGIDAELVACPWQPNHSVARIALTTAEFNRDERRPVNLVFLVDVSGSMGPDDRLPRFRRAVSELTGQLGERDHVAIVTYAGGAHIALDPTPGDRRKAIMRAVDGLSAGGGTNGSAGISEAYRLARKYRSSDATSSVVLVTDGDFNVGVTNTESLVDLVRKEARDRIFLTVVGVGYDNLRDRQLEHIADQGHGVYAYLDSEQTSRTFFRSKLLAVLCPVAQDVKIQVFFNPRAVSAWRLIGYENRVLRRNEFNDDDVDAGVIGAGHTVTALYELVPADTKWKPATSENPFITAKASERETDEAPEPTCLRVRVRYQPIGGGTSRLIESDLNNSYDQCLETNPDTAWALAVAEFGLLLRASPHRGTSNWNDIERLAEESHKSDREHADFVDLVQRARRLDRIRREEE